MKKSLLALAAMGAFAGAAQAQSSVTVYGIIDMGMAGGNSRTANGTDVTKQTALGVQQSAQSTSRLGFRGTEDLGGGMRAFFTFETTLRPNNTTATAAEGDQLSSFNNRQAFVGIAQKGIGQVALGTQQTIIHNVVGRTTAGQQNNLVGDVIYSIGGGTGGGLAALAGSYGMVNGQSYAVRVNNAITFASDTFAGFQGNAMLVLSNNNSTQTGANAGGESNTSGYGLGVNYTWKKLFLTANYQSFTNALNTVTPGTSPTTAPSTFTQFSPGQAATRGTNVNDNTVYVAGSYDFGILQAFVGYINRKVNAENNNLYFNRYTAQQIGVRSNLTPTVNVFASVGNGSWEQTGYDLPSAKINGYQLGSNYMLSKRTNLYAIFGNASQSNALNSTINPATARNTSYNINNYAVGVRHTF
ncbi:porin [Polynucleobacter acidiphobus]|uniref:porin n=1 Tax=Polynucleobacter acidiphobus TaxID=556053 RepID=UPI000D390B5D|nr:porin [Polynucleobacter acidiphobus]